MKRIIDIEESDFTFMRKTTFVEDTNIMLHQTADDRAKTLMMFRLVDAIKESTPYNPTGEWYYSIDKGWECKQCHEIVKDMPTCMRKALYNFCPNCGAELRKGGAK